ncbi:hypothetical protein VTO73DRAFT_8588 [Trametes versicolor]
MQVIEPVITGLQTAKLAALDIPALGLSIVIEHTHCCKAQIKDIKDTRDDCRALAELAVGFVSAMIVDHLETLNTPQLDVVYSEYQWTITT